ncbi:hypothetical protein V8E55_010666 [Tylopilus felleus]
MRAPRIYPSCHHHGRPPLPAHRAQRRLYAQPDCHLHHLVHALAHRHHLCLLVCFTAVTTLRLAFVIATLPLMHAERVRAHRWMHVLVSHIASLFLLISLDERVSAEESTRSRQPTITEALVYTIVVPPPSLPSLLLFRRPDLYANDERGCTGVERTLAGRGP